MGFLRSVLLGQGGEKMHPTGSFSDFGMHVQLDGEKELHAPPAHLVSGARTTNDATESPRASGGDLSPASSQKHLNVGTANPWESVFNPGRTPNVSQKRLNVPTQYDKPEGDSPSVWEYIRRSEAAKPPPPAE
ncbi:unnamed protein product [Pedinophyceae sp. YPF-701]|nr:unnamed protein product [Pedinophyceae sp. YPF-701]